jgi:prephenate dehydrogenase
VIDRLAIIGVGLIGGSVALALREAGICSRVIGCGRQPVHLEEAQRLGVIDTYSTDPAQAVAEADVVLIAVPLGAMGPVMAALAPGLRPDAVITDAGSAKACVVADARANLGDAFPRFVPGHPIAGTEQSGVAAAFPSLFAGRRVVLTPVTETDAWAITRITEVWTATGADVEVTDVEHHDAVLAATSHLPHMLAFGLVDSLARSDDPNTIFRYAAGGFRDFTRIAASDPVMWRDICLNNRRALLESLSRYRADLDAIRTAIEQGDGDQLEHLFRRAKQARDALTFNAP